MPEPEKKSHAWIIAAVFAALAYFFIAARPLGKEFALTPRWASGLEARPSPGQAAKASETMRSFEFRDRFGYYSPEGEFFMSAKASGPVAISRELYAEYGAKGANAVFRRPDGSEAFAISEPGRPAFVSGRLFLVQPDEAGLAEYSLSGRRQWSRDLSSLLTCFDANGEYAVAGALDGKLSVIALDGSLAYGYSPGGSRIPVILGCAISPDSSLIALVCGVDKQRFLLLERKADGYRVAYHAYLRSDFRRRVYIDFTEDGKSVLYEREGGLAIMNVKTRKTANLPVSGRVAAVRTAASGGVSLILSSEGPANRLKIFKAAGTAVVDAAFDASDAFLDRDGDSIYLGLGDDIARIDMGER